MKLTWKRITVHTTYPFRIARPGSSVKGDGTDVERTIAAIEHDGVIGYGEAAPTPYYNQNLDTVEDTLAKAGLMLGDDPEDIDGIIDRLLDQFDDHRAAVSAIDLALHDLLGKIRNKPVWDILGLNPADTPMTSMTIGIDRLDLLPEKVKQAFDFKILKIKVGTDADVETLTEIRRLAPKKLVRVDANCGWPADRIIECMQDILPFDLEFIEQPTTAKSYEAVKKAREQSPIPLIADEDSAKPSDVEKLVGVYDGINIKMAKCGGIREGIRMIKLARENNMQVMLGAMVETSLGISGGAHIASLVDYADLDGHLLLADDPYEGLIVREGKVLPGNGPGLGVTWKG